MNTKRILFENVGRERLTFEADIVWNDVDDEPVFESMVGAIKRKKALGSNDIDFAYDGDKPIAEGGPIYVGGYRNVGTWRIVTPAPSATEPT